MRGYVCIGMAMCASTLSTIGHQSAIPVRKSVMTTLTPLVCLYYIPDIFLKLVEI